MKYAKEDASLETLLHLDGEIFPMDNGFWTKFEVSRVTPMKQIPHGNSPKRMTQMDTMGCALRN